MTQIATECLPLTGTGRCPCKEHTAYHNNKRGVLLYCAKRPSNYSYVTTGSVWTRLATYRTEFLCWCIQFKDIVNELHGKLRGKFYYSITLWRAALIKFSVQLDMSWLYMKAWWHRRCKIIETLSHFSSYSLNTGMRRITTFRSTTDRI